MRTTAATSCRWPSANGRAAAATAEDGALLLIDADQFKSLKGSHGAACCDALLRDLTRLVTQSLRQPDLLARYGAEALIVYLPNTDPMGALDVAERIRERIAGHTLRWQNGGVSSTVSVGVASVGATHVTLDALVQDGWCAAGGQGRRPQLRARRTDPAARHAGAAAVGGLGPARARRPGLGPRPGLIHPAAAGRHSRSSPGSRCRRAAAARRYSSLRPSQ